MTATMMWLDYLAIWTKNFVQLNSSANKTVKYFVGLIQEIGPDGYNTSFLKKRPTCYIYFLPETEGKAVIDLPDAVLMLPHPGVSGSGRRIVTIIFGIDLLGYNIN
jgi:hypothetical protein